MGSISIFTPVVSPGGYNDPGGGSSSGGGGEEPPASQMASEVAQYGITVTFDQEYEVGQYANGDWWVVGPVDIVAVNPPVLTNPTSGWEVNGAMLNPTLPPLGGPRPVQGWHSNIDSAPGQVFLYNDSLNLVKGISVGSPLTVNRGSLVLSRGTETDPGQNVRPYFQAWMVLTVVDTAPAAGSFRPPYADPGNDAATKDLTPPANVSDINWTLLGTITAGAGMTTTPPSFNQCYELVKFLKMEYGFAHNIQPLMVDLRQYGLYPYAYGADVASTHGMCMARLMMDDAVSTDPEAVKLVVALCQRAIDIFEVTKVPDIEKSSVGTQLITNTSRDSSGKAGTAGPWNGTNGHGNGRLALIIFAGLVLGLDDLRDVRLAGNYRQQGAGPGYGRWSETHQYFYVQYSNPPTNTIVNWNQGGYSTGDVGTAEWSHNHVDANQDDSALTFLGSQGGYRYCCTLAAHWGDGIVMRIMGAQPYFLKSAFFDYQYRFSMFAPGIVPNYESNLSFCGSSNSAAIWDGGGVVNGANSFPYQLWAQEESNYPIVAGLGTEVIP